MKICVTSAGDNLEAEIDPRFGRAAYFIFIDTETMQFRAIKNLNVDAAGGAGINSAQLVAKEGAEAVLTGNLGPNATNTLSSLNLKTFLGASGTVKEAVEKFKEGKL